MCESQATTVLVSGQSDVLSMEQLLQRVERVRKGSHAIFLLIRQDDTMDTMTANAIDFSASAIEAECEAIAASLRALCPA